MEAVRFTSPAYCADDSWKTSSHVGALPLQPSSMFIEIC